MDQAQFAELLGSGGRLTISKLERGNLSQIPINTLLHLLHCAKGHGLSADEFLLGIHPLDVYDQKTLAEALARRMGQDKLAEMGFAQQVSQAVASSTLEDFLKFVLERPIPQRQKNGKESESIPQRIRSKTKGKHDGKRQG